MAIQNTDLLLIDRTGSSYKVAASDLVDTVQAGDLALVNRAGSSYKLSGTNLLDGTFADTDLFIINRGGLSYKVVGSEVKELLNVTVTPITQSAVWTFVQKTTLGSTFALTITFNSSTPIDLNLPTEARVEISAFGSNGLATLLAVTNTGGDTYEAEDWLNSTSSTPQTVQPNFTDINSGQQISFNLFIPNTINLIGTGSVSAGTTALAEAWQGTAGVYQNNFGNTITSQGFTSSSAYFN